MRGIDYAWARPDPAQIAARGYQFVCRYLSHDASKNISNPETQALITAGLAVVLVWETTAARAADGYDAGVIDAQEASRAAYSVGQPEDRPIYFAVDYDAPPAAVADYFAGVVSVLGRGRTGVYASYRVVKALLDGAVVAYAWQTLAWSGGQVDSRVNLYQTGETDFSQQADVDQAYQPDYGQWPYQEEDDVTPEQMQQILAAVAAKRALSETYIPMEEGGYIGTCSLPIWMDDQTFADFIIVFNTAGVGTTVNLMDALRNIIQTKEVPMVGMVVFDGLNEMYECHIEASAPVVVVHRTTQK